MQMRYSMACWRPAHAGTRTLIFRTGGGGSLTGQSSTTGTGTATSAASCPRRRSPPVMGGEEKGSRAARKSAPPKQKREIVANVFMAVRMLRKDQTENGTGLLAQTGCSLSHYQFAETICH